jgi:hypothetical protein
MGGNRYNCVRAANDFIRQVAGQGEGSMKDLIFIIYLLFVGSQIVLMSVLFVGWFIKWLIKVFAG